MLILLNAFHQLICDKTSEETGVKQLPILRTFDWSKTIYMHCGLINFSVNNNAFHNL